MARDSLFGETIVWSGRAKKVTIPALYKVTASVSAVLALVTLCYAIVVSTSLGVPVGGMLVFSGWCATIALASWRVPIMWHAQAEYIVTDKHVIWRRGRIRRTIERRSVSYAIIRWSRDKTVGDLMLVRAVPTGAMRRTLSLTFLGVEAPDRLWATVRGVEASAPLGDGGRPIAQRLDEGERVLWSAMPMAAPWTMRRATKAAVAAIATFAFVHTLVRGVPAMTGLARSQVLPPAMTGLVIAGAALGGLLLLSVALGIGYAALVRPIRLARATRYFVTDTRVLIRRGDEELQLDRATIAYVIDAPAWSGVPGDSMRGLHHVFLVLDGPQARALAPSGAFGGADTLQDGPLQPVFAAIVDPETVGKLLRTTRELRKAA